MCVCSNVFPKEPKCVFCRSGQKRNMKKFPPACLNQPSSQCDCSIGSWCAGLRLSGVLSCNLSANQSSLPSQSSSHWQALLLSPSPSGDPPFFLVQVGILLAIIFVTSGSLSASSVLCLCLVSSHSEVHFPDQSVSGV